MKKLLALFAVAISMLAVNLYALPVFAADPTPGDAVCTGIGLASADGTCDPAGQSTSVGQIITSVISILTYIIGIAAIIMILVGGFKYISAGGDSNAIGSAKTTIVYALVGLVVAFSAQILVRYVLTKAVATPPTAPTVGTYTCNDGTVVNKVGNLPKSELCGPGN